MKDALDLLAKGTATYPQEEADTVRGHIASLEARLGAAEEVVADYEAWLGAALKALGVETVFDIPDWRENLAAAVTLNEAERAEARKALATASGEGAEHE